MYLIVPSKLEACGATRLLFHNCNSTLNCGIRFPMVVQWLWIFIFFYWQITNAHTDTSPFTDALGGKYGYNNERVGSEEPLLPVHGISSRSPWQPELLSLRQLLGKRRHHRHASVFHLADYLYYFPGFYFISLITWRDGWSCVLRCVARWAGCLWNGARVEPSRTWGGAPSPELEVDLLKECRCHQIADFVDCWENYQIQNFPHLRLYSS
jgi:hypothetical protein